MSYQIKRNNISITRGDTLKAYVNIKNPDGSDYEPVEGDVIQFAVKKSYNDTDYLISKFIDPNTMILIIEPEDTKELAYGDYVYDMQLTNAVGEVDTFITTSDFVVTEEVC